MTVEEIPISSTVCVPVGVALYLVATCPKNVAKEKDIDQNNVAMRLTKCRNNVTVAVLQ